MNIQIGMYNIHGQGWFCGPGYIIIVIKFGQMCMLIDIICVCNTTTSSGLKSHLAMCFSHF